MTRLNVLINLGMVCLPMLGAAIASSRADDLSGTWDVGAKFSIVGGPADGRSTTMKAVLQLAQKGAAVTGTFTPYAEDGKTAQPAMPLLNGRVTGTALAFSVKQDAETSLTFALVLADGHLRGTARPSKDVSGGGKLAITIEATRRK